MVADFEQGRAGGEQYVIVGVVMQREDLTTSNVSLPYFDVVILEHQLAGDGSYLFSMFSHLRPSQ